MRPSAAAQGPSRRSSASTRARSPTSRIAQPSSLAARKAPSTALCGAKSPPMASTAIGMTRALAIGRAPRTVLDGRRRAGAGRTGGSGMQAQLLARRRRARSRRRGVAGERRLRAFSLPSITCRPRYWPQLGQARCGSLTSPQFGQVDMAGISSASCARRLSRRALEWRRFGFGMVVEPLQISSPGIGTDSTESVLISLRAGSSARRGTPNGGPPWVSAQEQAPSFRSAPHSGQSPLQSSRQSGFIGTLSWSCSIRMGSVSRTSSSM